MHILHSEASGHWGGQEMRTLMDAVRFLRAGHRVTILAPPRAALTARAREAGLETVPLRLGHPPWSPAVVARLTRLFKRLGAEVVHTHSSADSWAAGLAARLAGAALVRTRHICAPMEHRVLGRRLIKPVYRLPDALIATSAAIRDTLAALGVEPRRLHLLPSGIDLDRFRPRQDVAALRSALGLAGAPVVTMVAMLRPEKRADLFLEAAALLARSFPEALFLLAGHAEQVYLAALKEQAERLGIAARVRFLGHREDVPELIAASDVCVLPSAGNEGTPQAVIQYLAMARPVVATAVGGVPEVIEEGRTGLLVRPGDAAQLSGSVAWLLGNPERAQAMAGAGRWLVTQRFDADRVAERTLEIYARLTRDRAR